MSSKLEAKLCVAVLGTGRMGKIHLASLQRDHPDVAVADVVGVEGKAAVAAAFPRLFADARRPTVYLDAAEGEGLWADGSVDAVVVATPTDLHAAHVRRALEAGKHVFCEKPLAPGLRETEELLGLAAARGLRLFCAFQRRFDPAFAAVHQRVAGGELGPLHLLKSTSRDPASAFDPATTGGHSIFLDSSVHDMDMLCWLAGEGPEWVFASGAVRGAGAAGGAQWDVVAATLGFPSGALGLVDQTRHAAFGYDQRLEVLGAKGQASVDNRPLHSASFLGPSGALSAPPQPYFQSRYEEAYRAELRHFLRLVAGEEEEVVSANDILLALRVATAAQRSAATGLPVHLSSVI